MLLMGRRRRAERAQGRQRLGSAQACGPPLGIADAGSTKQHQPLPHRGAAAPSVLEAARRRPADIWHSPKRSFRLAECVRCGYRYIPTSKPGVARLGNQNTHAPLHFIFPIRRQHMGNHVAIGPSGPTHEAGDWRSDARRRGAAVQPGPCKDRGSHRIGAICLGCEHMSSRQCQCVRARLKWHARVVCVVRVCRRMGGVVCRAKSELTQRAARR